MPRAAVLSIHARVAATKPSTWDDSSLVQVWGPRYSVFVVAERDLAIFTLGRLPDDAAGRRRAEDAAARVRTVLGTERRMGYGEVGHALGVNANSLRYGTTTGTMLIRWEGARQPVLWSVPAPAMNPHDARLELARRYLSVYGPGTAAGFVHWAGIADKAGPEAFEALGASVTPVRTPVGDAWILTDDEEEFRRATAPTAAARLLPSGDAFYLLWGADRELLVSDARRRAQLWTSRVWPGALLVDGEIAGIWNRNQHKLTVETWRRLSRAQREAIEAEAASLPLPVEEPVGVNWKS